MFLLSVENIITLGKLTGLLLFCPHLLSILLLKTPKIQGMSSLGNHFSSVIGVVSMYI